MNSHGRPRRWPRLTLSDWGRGYDRRTLLADTLAAVIVTIMLIPQSLAYAQLAGLRPEIGLYASIVPLLGYALFGTSRVLAVGPVAVVSLMTAAAIGTLGLGSPNAQAAAALVLALMSGAMLLAMGLLRLGFLAAFLSHPVMSGFVSASGLLIAASQLKTLLGVPGTGHTLPQLAASLWSHAGEVHLATLAIGAAGLAYLVWARRSLAPLLRRFGLRDTVADRLARAGPLLGIAASTLAAWALDAQAAGVKLVGAVPAGLPPLTWPAAPAQVWLDLLVPALLISIVGFAESVSVAQTLAARRRQRIEPDQELVALGTANLGAAFTGGYPVTGGFARSIVNFDAGAQTPAAGAFTAVGIALATLLLTPALQHLPQAMLAATIVVAVLSLVELQTLRRTWAYSKADFAAVAATLLGTLGFGVETGLVIGVSVSLTLHLLRSSRPHIAVVGLVPGTEHFRNVERHAVRTSPRLISLRVDESLYFANARVLEDRINDAVATMPALEHVVLQCSAINSIDASALESLEAIEHRLHAAGVTLHLSEVKGPVMDRLRPTGFARTLRGGIYLTHHQAIAALTPEVIGSD